MATSCCHAVGDRITFKAQKKKEQRRHADHSQTKEEDTEKYQCHALAVSEKTEIHRQTFNSDDMT